MSIYKKLVKTEPKKTDNEEKLKRKSTDKLKEIHNNTYDGKIRDKMSDIRMILSRLQTIVTKKDKKKIMKELYEIEKKQDLSDKEKKRFIIILSS